MTGQPRMLFHGPYPDMPTGYAAVLRDVIPRVAAAGWDVGISCTAGIVRHNTTWRGHMVYGRSPYTDMAEDLVQQSYADFGADVIITMCCPWKLHGAVWRAMRTIHLMPVDRDPLGVPDYKLISEGGGMPAAVSRFGEQVIRARGLDPLYLPHAVDTAFWMPPADRKKMRQGMGLDHVFLVGINASNTDPGDRKQLYESFAGFARFHLGDEAAGIAPHPRSVLAVHASPVLPDGVNLPAMAAHLRIPPDAVMYSDMYQTAGAGAPLEGVRAWYGGLDVLMQLGNEGYGLPAAEAMACGTPVIAGTWCTGPELAGDTGWLCEGQPRWNDAHQADWHVPLIPSVAAALDRAHGEAAGRRAAARDYAVANLDAARLFEEHWVPVLKDLAGG